VGPNPTSGSTLLNILGGNMVIWKDIGILIKNKTLHIKKIGGKLYRSFIIEYGDIPAIRYNEQTKKFEEVENNRGRAYAARKRLKYRKRK
jgi:hypothetical protein